MPLWLFVILIIAAYAFVSGVTYATVSGYGEVRCEYDCDWRCAHRWGELFSAILWPFGIPVFLGIWLSRKLSPKREHISVLRRQLAEAYSSLSEKDRVLAQAGLKQADLEVALEAAEARLAWRDKLSDESPVNAKELR